MSKVRYLSVRRERKGKGEREARDYVKAGSRAGQKGARWGSCRQSLAVAGSRGQWRGSWWQLVAVATAQYYGRQIR